MTTTVSNLTRVEVPLEEIETMIMERVLKMYPKGQMHNVTCVYGPRDAAGINQLLRIEVTVDTPPYTE
jgi:hypothetical protein